MATKKDYTVPRRSNSTRSIEMATADYSKLSYAELVKLQKELADLATGKRDAETNDFIKRTLVNAEAIGLSLEDLIKALELHLPKSGPVRGSKRAGTAKKGDKVMPERGATYKHPETGETYTRPESGKGRVIKWLQDLVDAGGTYEKYKV